MGEAFSALFLLVMIILLAKPLTLLIMALVSNPVLLVLAAVVFFIAGAMS